MKELVKTTFIETLLRGAVGPDVDLTALHVFEVTATSTVALRGKTNTIFEDGRITPNTISQLAASVNNDPIPLMMDHVMEGTPFGKFFYAESIPTDEGEIELRGFIYVDDSDQDILTKIESASIDEVSICFLPERLLCSECGFDFIEAKENSDFMPLLTRTCPDGHIIGQDGVHGRLVGVAETLELSLVSRGAAKKSKIIGPSDAMLGQTAQRLAANGVNVLENYYCMTSMKDVEGENKVDTTKLLETVTKLTSDKAKVDVELNTVKTEIAALTASVETEKARADAAEAKVAELTAEKETLSASLADIKPEAVESYKTHAGKTYVALKTLSGEENASVPEDFNEVMAFIDENHAKLSALIPTDGVSTGADSKIKTETEVEKSSRLASLASFKSN